MKRFVQIFIFFSLIPPVFAQAPEWWTDREVIDVAKSPNDFAPVNQGQLKHLATQAYEELQENLPGGGGAELQRLTSSWSVASGNDFLPVNLGQLKNLARSFYDRLISVGFTDQYPWDFSSNSPNDFALANVGQVKNLFSFNITYSSDSDPLPDWWRLLYFEDLEHSWDALAPGDPFGQLTLGGAFMIGRDPIKIALQEEPGSAGLLVGLEVYAKLNN